MIDFKPKLRKNAATEFHHRIVTATFLAIEKSTEENIFPFQSCLSCIHFRENEGEICVRYNSRPPAKVIVNGCNLYEDEAEIPF